MQQPAPASAPLSGAAPQHASAFASPLSPIPGDALLAEYLRVINHKDGEIYNLIAQVQRLEMEAKKKEDKYKSRLRELKTALESVQSHAEGDDRRRSTETAELARIRIERDQLVSDVATLKVTLQRQEEHMNAALKSASKAAKHEASLREKHDVDAQRQRRSYDEREQSLQDRIAILESQGATLQRRAVDGEAEIQRLKQELSRATEQRGEYEEAIRDARRRLREAAAKEHTHAELAASESRNVATIQSLEQELAQVRAQLMDEVSKANRRDMTNQELRNHIQKIEADLVAATRGAQDAEVVRAQEKLVRAQQLEQWRNEAEDEFKRLEELTVRLNRDRSQLQSDLTLSTKRVQELELKLSSVELALRQRDEASEKESHSYKLRMVDLQHEADAARRLASQQEAVAKHFRERLESQREEAVVEAARLREELEIGRTQASRQQAANGALESQLMDARRELANAQSENSAATRREGDLRRRNAELEDNIRLLRDHDTARKLEHDVALKEQSTQSNNTIRELQRDLTIAKADVTALREQLATIVDRHRHTEADLAAAQSQLASKAERERSLTASQRELDEKVVKLEMAVAERDAAANALRRALESASASQGSAQSALEDVSRRHQHQHAQNEQLRADLSLARQQAAQREEEKAELVRQLQKYETQAATQTQELTSQVVAMKDRVRELLSELQAAEQRVVMERAERARLEARHSDDALTTNRNVVGPLQDKVDALVAMNQRVQRDLQDREARIVELQRQLADSQTKETRLEVIWDDLRRAQDEVVRLKAAERDLASEKETTRRLRSELDQVGARSAALEQANDTLTRELHDVRSREASAAAQLGSRKAEVSSLYERNANLESLKAIAERQLTEALSRERVLTAKLEETRQSQSVLQTCFNQQQEQLESLRRLKQAAPQPSASAGDSILVSTPQAASRGEQFRRPGSTGGSPNERRY